MLDGHLAGSRRRPGFRLLAALAFLVACLAPTAASAHGGSRALTAREGPYAVVVDDRLVAVPGGAVLDSTVYLRDARSGRPVSDARVRVNVEGQDGRLSSTVAHRRGNTYETLLPLRHPDRWRQLRFDVEVTSPLGVARFSHRAPPLDRWLWNQPVVLAGVAVALAAFLHGWWRLRRRRRDLASYGHLVAFSAGLAILVLAVVSPIDPIGEQYLVSAHMLQHVLLGDLAPALLVLGIFGPLALFVVPAPLLRRLARAPLLPALAAWLLRPAVALWAWALVYGVWHVPALYDAALRHRYVHDLEHATFLLAGLLVWSQIIDPLPGRRLPRSRRILTALVLFGLGTVLADVLIFSFRPLYPVYADQPERLLGLSPLTDQRLAGLVMLIEQTLTVGVALAILLLPERLRRRRPAAGALERA